ncbi:MAG: hypothetical protein CR991_04175 [Proteobacteria bacterium]|nr:MAG: hypothetical protein CR991_04175 [Pseudomonadota bacterium]
MDNQEIDYQAGYDNFVAEVKRSGKVWGLTTKDGEDNWAVCPSAMYEETDVMPLFSSREKAQQHCIDEWEIYQPQAVVLEEFVNDWLPGLHEDEALIGPDWDMDLAGLEIEPMDVAEDLETVD